MVRAGGIAVVKNNFAYRHTTDGGGLVGHLNGARAAGWNRIARCRRQGRTIVLLGRSQKIVQEIHGIDGQIRRSCVGEHDRLYRAASAKLFRSEAHRGARQSDSS